MLLNNKADFILLYNELLHKRLQKNDIDWSQSKVIFIAPTYTEHQKQSINFKDLPIELWEIKKFENDTIMYLPVKPNQQTESITALSSTNTSISKVSQEVKIYNEADHLNNKSITITELYEKLKLEIVNLGDLKFKVNKQYISFVGNTKNVVDIVIMQSKIKVFINLRYSQIDDHKNMVRDVSNIGSWGNGDCEFTLRESDDIDYLVSLVKQSYKVNG